MQRKKNGNLEWLEFDLLSDIPALKHALFLRHGGCSQGPYNSLNSGFHVGDQREDVHKNLTLIKGQMGCENFIHGIGCHGKHVEAVDSRSKPEVPECDGLTTATPGLTLFMTYADCQIGLMYDPVHRAIGNIHSGWRGSAQNILAEAVRKMQGTYGSNPADLLVCISPSLGPDEAEFINYRHELPEEFWHFQVRPTYFDFWSISEAQLQAAGILPHHIEVARLSTYSNPHDFFSHRRDKVTGRHGACITLLNNRNR